MAIVRDLVLTVNNDTASLNEPVFIYQGDRGIELDIKIQRFKYKFGRKVLEDMVDDTIMGARAIIIHESHGARHDESNPPKLDPENGGTCFQISARQIRNNTIIIDISEEWINEIHEIGAYDVYIQLYGEPLRDENGNIIRNENGDIKDFERITLPPVKFHVKELLCDPAEQYTGFPTTSFPESTVKKEYGFDLDGNNEYDPYEFESGDLIPYTVLNAMEDALVYLTTDLKDKVNQEILDRNHADTDLSNAITNATDTLNSRIDTVNSNISDLDQDIRNEANTRATNDAQINTRIETLQTNTYNLGERIGTLEKDTKTWIAEAVDGLEEKYDSDIDALDGKITTLQTNTQTWISEAVGELETQHDKDIEDLDGKIDTLETNTKEWIDVAVDELEAKHNSDKQLLNTRIETLQTNTKTWIAEGISESEEKMNGIIESNVSTLNSKIQVLRGDLTQETQNRIAQDNALNTHISEVETDLNETKQKLEDEKVMESLQTGSSITISDTKLQYFSLTQATSITLPTLDNKHNHEIHLFVRTGSEVFPISFTNVSAWQLEPELDPNMINEFIFTWLAPIGMWIGGYVTYEILQ